MGKNYRNERLKGKVYFEVFTTCPRSDGGAMEKRRIEKHHIIGLTLLPFYDHSSGIPPFLYSHNLGTGLDINLVGNIHRPRLKTRPQEQPSGQ